LQKTSYSEGKRARQKFVYPHTLKTKKTFQEKRKLRVYMDVPARRKISSKATKTEERERVLQKKA